MVYRIFESYSPSEYLVFTQEWALWLSSSPIINQMERKTRWGLMSDYQSSDVSDMTDASILTLVEGSTSLRVSVDVCSSVKTLSCFWEHLKDWSSPNCSGAPSTSWSFSIERVQLKRFDSMRKFRFLKTFALHKLHHSFECCLREWKILSMLVCIPWKIKIHRLHWNQCVYPGLRQLSVFQLYKT